MFYKVTLTKSEGLNDEEVNQIAEYFKQCKHCMLVNEQGESKDNSHVEGIVEFDTEVTSNVTKRVRGLYQKMDIEVTPGITFRVKKASHLIGALIYASKELAKEGKLILLKGWEQTWIDKQIKDNVKSIPHSMLKKLGTRLNQRSGPALMYEWCKANNKEVKYKVQYLEVVRDMSEQGFLFGTVKHSGMLSDLCGLFGCGVAAMRQAESELRFID